MLSSAVYIELQPRQSLVPGLAPVSICHPLVCPAASFSQRSSILVIAQDAHQRLAQFLFFFGRNQDDACLVRQAGAAYLDHAFPRTKHPKNELFVPRHPDDPSSAGNDRRQDFPVRAHTRNEVLPLVYGHSAEGFYQTAVPVATV